MLRYHVAYFLPRADDRMVVAEVLDFPGVVSQGFDLAGARLMIASALEDIAQMHEEGKALPVPNPDATAADRPDRICSRFRSRPVPISLETPRIDRPPST
jgi:predicted RNase H-like HicB family nuclease